MNNNSNISNNSNNKIKNIIIKLETISKGIDTNSFNNLINEISNTIDNYKISQSNTTDEYIPNEGSSIEGSSNINLLDNPSEQSSNINLSGNSLKSSADVNLLSNPSEQPSIINPPLTGGEDKSENTNTFLNTLTSIFSGGDNSSNNYDSETEQTYMVEADDSDEESFVDKANFKNKKYLTSLNVSDLREIMRYNNMKLSKNGAYLNKKTMVNQISKNL